MKKIKIILISFIVSTISFYIFFLIFKPVLLSDTVIFPYAVHPFNICEKQPKIWNSIKFLCVFTYIFSNSIIFNYIFSKIFSRKKIIKQITK